MVLSLRKFWLSSMAKILFFEPDFSEEAIDRVITACVMSAIGSGSGGSSGGRPGKPRTTPAPTSLGLDEDPFADE